MFQSDVDMNGLIAEPDIFRILSSNKERSHKARELIPTLSFFAFCAQESSIARTRRLLEAQATPIALSMAASSSDSGELSQLLAK